MNTPDNTPRCLQAGPDCSGAVNYRMATSPSGRSFPRCDRHWSQHLATVEGIRRRYPDTSVAPADFDPSYAGEQWDED